MPCEGMKGNTIGFTPANKLGAGGSINMKLPFDCSKRVEIINWGCGRPWQAIAAPDFTGFAPANRTVAVINCDLGDRTKHVFPCCLELEQCRQDNRNDAGSKEICHLTLRSRECESSIGGCHKLSREGSPLNLIAIKEVVCGSTGEHGLQFPCQIDRITNAGVHALPARGAVNVSGVAQ